MLGLHAQIDREGPGAAETVAGVLLGTGWTCAGCKGVYIGTAPESGLCETCSGDDGAAGVPVPA